MAEITELKKPSIKTMKAIFFFILVHLLELCPTILGHGN